MDVSIKSFDVAMDVKTNGVEFGIREPNGGDRLGDLFITKAHLIWCKGKTQRAQGIKIKWTDFVEMVNAVTAPAKKTTAKKSPAKKTRAKRTAKKVAVKPIAPATEPITE
jgi:hypothetical protein